MAEETATLNLSDDEFMKQAPPDFSEETEETTEKPEVEDTTTSESAEADTTGEEEETPASEEADSEAQEDTEEDPAEEEVADPEGDTQTEDETSTEESDTESLDTSKQDSPDTKKDTSDTKEFDYESAYKKVIEPFKANGVEMAVKDPQDIIRLMQMGANYAKKMAQLKPNLKMVKMLANNDIDESKLHNLIDISKKDPKAIAKLIKESGIDPTEIDTEGSVDYKPTDYSISDKEYNLDQVLESIKDTPTFNKTIDLLAKEWDAESKSAISENPEIISIINTHMGNGVFDKVNTMIQQEKSLGRLNGISDVQAYHQAAEFLHKNGQLREEKGTSVLPHETKTDPLAAAALKKKKKAVAPVKHAPGKKTKKLEDEDFLGLSDKEFMNKFAAG